MNYESMANDQLEKPIIRNNNISDFISDNYCTYLQVTNNTQIAIKFKFRGIDDFELKQVRVNPVRLYYVTSTIT